MGWLGDSSHGGQVRQVWTASDFGFVKKCRIPSDSDSNHIPTVKACQNDIWPGRRGWAWSISEAEAAKPRWTWRWSPCVGSRQCRASSSVIPSYWNTTSTRPQTWHQSIPVANTHSFLERIDRGFIRLSCGHAKFSKWERDISPSECSKWRTCWV